MRRGEQNQQRAEKQHDEFIQEAEETRSRLHLEIPTGGIISHAAGSGKSRMAVIRYGWARLATVNLVSTLSV